MSNIAKGPNIGFSADAGNVKVVTADINKSLDAISTTPLEKLREKTEEAANRVNGRLATVVSNLDKLKKELANTGGTDNRLLKKTEAEFNRLKNLDAVSPAQSTKIKGVLEDLQTAKKAQASGEGGEGGGDIKEVAKTVEELIGGKFSLKKGAKFGIAGIAASVLSDTVSEATSKAIEIRDEGGSQEKQNAALLESLPILGGIYTAAKNISELQSHAAQDARSYNALLEDQYRNYEGINRILEERRDLNKSAAVEDANTAASFAASLLGGRGGRAAVIDANLQQQRSGIEEKRDAKIKSIDEAEKAATEKNDAEAEEINKRNPSGQLRQRDAQRLDALRQANTDILFNSQFERDDVKANAAKEIAGAKEQAEKRKQIALGLAEDTKGVQDRLASLAADTNTISGDPFEGMRKSFLELKPDAENLEAFNKQLEAYRDRVSEAEKESRKFGAEKTIKQIFETGSTLSGLNSTDRATRELLNAGITDKELIAKVKVQLDINEAVTAAKEVADKIAGIGDSANVSLGRNRDDRIRAEVEAESNARKRATGTGYTDDEKRNLTTAKRDEAIASAAAATREAVKSPRQIAQEAFDSLREQKSKGFITDDELKGGVGKTLSSYADAIRTSRPELLTAGSASTNQFLAVQSGGVLDSSKPEIELAKQANDILQQLLDQAKTGKTGGVNINL